MKNTMTSLGMLSESWRQAAAMPCKRAFPQACIRETVVSETEKAKASEAKTRCSCITEAHEIHKTKNRVSNEKDS